jgi:hypothetical protein
VYKVKGRVYTDMYFQTSTTGTNDRSGIDIKSVCQSDTDIGVGCNG